MPHPLWYPGHEILLTDIVRAEGSRVYDSAGRSWLDLEAGVWAASIGHSHPRIAAALNDQYGAIAHTGFNYTSPIVREAIEELLRVVGLEDGIATLLCSGSEANEFCVRVLTDLMPRPKLLTFTDSYFGAYGSAHGRDAERWATFDWLACPACAAGETCGDIGAHLDSIVFDEIGAFVLEPGSSSGFVRFPPAALVETIAHRVRDQGGFVMVNEVTTGVGRTGKWFGYQHYGVQPDAVAIGKGIGGGYPVAAAVLGARVASKLSGPPAYAQSHQNDPLGAAVLLAVVHAIEKDGLIDQGREMGEFLLAGLEDLKNRTAKLTAVRGRGPLSAVDLVGDAKETARVHRALVEAGYLVCLRPGSRTLRFDPALNFPRGEIEGFLRAFAATLS